MILAFDYYFALSLLWGSCCRYSGTGRPPTPQFSNSTSSITAMVALCGLPRTSKSRSLTPLIATRAPSVTILKRLRLVGKRKHSEQNGAFHHQKLLPFQGLLIWWSYCLARYSCSRLLPFQAFFRGALLYASLSARKICPAYFFDRNRTSKKPRPLPKPHCFIGLALIGKKKDFLFPWLIAQLDDE